MTRKCSICKELIDLNDTNEDFFITPNNKVNHTHCYINEQTTRKRKPKTIEECQLYIDECRQADREVEKKIK